jgi:hypothetical protein
VELGAVLARAGEGTIHEVVGRPEWVAKIFHPGLNDRAEKFAKVAAMIESPPSGAVQTDQFVVLTWPLHVVDGDAGPVGYIMRRIDTHDAVEIHTLSNPFDRLNPLASAPQWTQHTTWLHLTAVAANLCVAVEVVHRVDAVIGDFQERNILVNDTTRVTLVDCDSMQFTDAAGQMFLCGVGRSEFSAPELAGLNLAVTPRKKPSDLFALAVHIHLLLMAGNHPFLRGQWTGTGDQPDAMTLARAGHWAGGPGSPLRTHPLAPPVDFLPTNIQRLFVRAFTEGAADPASRPTATEWRAALQGLQVRNCVRGHQVPVQTEHCPWCRIDDLRATRKAKYEPTAQLTQTIYKVRSSGTAPPTTHVGPSVAGRSSGNGAKVAVAAVIAVLVVIAIIGFVLTDHPSTGFRAQPYTESITSTSILTAGVPTVEGSQTWREPGWAATPLYIDFSEWTRFGGIDAALQDNGESVVLDTHDTTQTWHTKWSGLISPKTTACAMRIVGQVRDISHSAGVPGGFAIGVGTLGTGDPDMAELTGAAMQFDFGHQRYRDAAYPSDLGDDLTSASLDHGWHQVEMVVNVDSQTLAVDGRTVATAPTAKLCGHPMIRVWAGSTEFSKFTVTPTD